MRGAYEWDKTSEGDRGPRREQKTPTQFDIAHGEFVIPLFLFNDYQDKTQVMIVRKDVAQTYGPENSAAKAASREVFEIALKAIQKKYGEEHVRQTDELSLWLPPTIPFSEVWWLLSRMREKAGKKK